MKIEVFSVLIFSIAFFTSCATGSEYGEQCARGDSDDCNTKAHLKCNNETETGYICGCDTEFALEDCDQKGICEPYRTKIGENCDGCFEDGNLCQNITGGECNGNICICSSNEYVQVGDVCETYTLQLGGTCKVLQQCNRISEPGGAICNLAINKCVCNNETHLPDLTSTRCLPYRHNIGDNCELPSQCNKLGEGAICNKTCGCDLAKDYFPHPDGSKCLKYAHDFETTCEPGTDVCKFIEGAGCNQTTKLCECDSNHVTHPNKTECPQYVTSVGSNCILYTTPDHCSNIGAECIGTPAVCVCDSNHFLFGKVCQPLAQKPLDLCLDTQHCADVDHTLCLNHLCICDASNGWTLSPDQLSCIRQSSTVNMTCTTSQDCNVVNNTQCLNQRCQCLPDYVEKQDRSMCLPIVQKLHANCFETPQCQKGIGTFSICEENSCSCQNQYIEHVIVGGKDRCLEVSPVNGSCEFPVQCEAALGENSDCVENRCGCNIYSSFLSNTCYRKVWLNGNCTLNEECIVGTNINARCYDNFCGCIPGKYESDGKCYGHPLINDECLDTAECKLSVNGTVECINGICSCRFLTDTSVDMATCAATALLNFQANVLNIVLFLFVTIINV